MQKILLIGAFLAISCLLMAGETPPTRPEVQKKL